MAIYTEEDINDIEVSIEDEPPTFVFEAEVTERRRFTVEADSLEEAEELIRQVENGDIAAGYKVEIEDGWDVFVIDWHSLRCVQDPTEDKGE